jgi:hypothetical protein
MTQNTSPRRSDRGFVTALLAISVGLIAIAGCLYIVAKSSDNSSDDRLLNEFQEGLLGRKYATKEEQLRAELEAANINVEIERARLAELKRNTFVSKKMEAAINSTFDAVNNALTKKADKIFENTDMTAPVLAIPKLQSEVKAKIQESRAEITKLMDEWREMLGKGVNYEELSKILQHISVIQEYVNNLTEVVNNLTVSNSGLTQSVIDKDKANVNGAKKDIDTAVNNVNTIVYEPPADTTSPTTPSTPNTPQATTTDTSAADAAAAAQRLIDQQKILDQALRDAQMIADALRRLQEMSSYVVPDTNPYGIQESGQLDQDLVQHPIPKVDDSGKPRLVEGSNPNDP